MDSYGESVEDHQQSNGHAASNNPDHGWQKVTYPKRHRKQKPGAADPSGQAQGDGNDKPSSVFCSLEKSSEDRRRRILEARAANAAVDAPVRSRQHRSDDDGDSEEDSDDGKGNEKVEEKKVKQKKPKKPKVTVAEAAAKIDVDHLSAFLADISPQDMAKGLVWATAEDLVRNRGRVLSLYRQLLHSLNSPSLPLNLAARLGKKAEVQAIFLVASEERSLHNIEDLIDTAEYALSILQKGEIPKYIQ